MYSLIECLAAVEIHLRNFFSNAFLSEQSVETLLEKGHIFKSFHYVLSCIKSVVLKEWIYALWYLNKAIHNGIVSCVERIANYC